ncbi:hypothetical protein BDY21DRAFT_270441, partial [Lineolata rhizophorae]
ASTRSCTICTCALPLSDFPPRPTARCAHPSSTCRPCLQTWIATALSRTAVGASDAGGGGGAAIRCPEAPGCGAKLGHADLALHAAPEVFARYDAWAARAALGREPGFRWCRAAGCGSGQIHEEGARGGAIFRCVACGSRFCAGDPRHDMVAWHEGETCGGYEARM